MERLNIGTLVRTYLQEQIERGKKQLALEEDVRPILREWMLAARRGSVAGRVAVQPPMKEGSQEVGEKRAAAQGEPTPSEPAISLSQMLQEDDRNEERGTSQRGEDEEPRSFFRPGGKTREELWGQAQKLIERWEPLRRLGTLREKVIWGEGSQDADIIFVGDAPGYYDEREGRPFCGEAGAKLDEMLKAMGLKRRDVYITYMVKFRPKMPRQTTNNRPPDREEIRMSVPVLEFEVKHVRPKVIVALGVIAARGILQRGELPLSEYQTLKEASFCGAPVVVTHHPSYLLRTTAISERRKLWEEMLRVMEFAHLPISAKQRGYFLPKA